MLDKLLSLFVYLRYGNMPIELRYFYRHTYKCQLIQLKYIWQDYIVRKPYKVIDFHGEFAPELQFVLPFAYWHFKNGTLKRTEGCTFSKEMYFFSPQHLEAFDIRTEEGNSNFETPRILYSQDYNMSKWLPVPFRDHFKNNFYKFEKPTLIIANRYNMEWNGPPISFYSIELLDYILEKVKPHYTVIYNRPRPHQITMDNSDIYDLNEHDWLKREHPDVILMEDLYNENVAGATSFNHLQFLVYANASKFISIHGGTATLASYFGGTNLIFSKKGPEHHFKCYEKLYPKLSGAKVFHAKTEDQVKDYVDKLFSTSMTSVA